MMDVIGYLDYIIDNKLSQQQYMFLYLLWKKDVDNDEVVRIVTKYKEYLGGGNIITPEEKVNLIKRGYVRKVDDEEKFKSYELTDKFLKHFIDPDAASEEIWILYPAFGYNEGGGSYPLKSMDKSKFKKMYAEAINYSAEEHEKVKLDILFGIKTGRIKNKIENFFKSEMYKDIREIRIKKPVNGKQQSVSREL